MNTIKEFRAELKAAGYTLQITTYSEFKAGTIKDENGNKLPSIFTAESLKQWQPAIAIRDKYKGQLFDGGFRVVI